MEGGFADGPCERKVHILFVHSPHCFDQLFLIDRAVGIQWGPPYFLKDKKEMVMLDSHQKLGYHSYRSLVLVEAF